MPDLYHQSRANVKNQKPGYLQNAFISPLAEFTTIGVPAGGGSGAAKITISDDHTFTGTKGFYKLYSLPHKHEGTMETNGDAGALNAVRKHTLVMPGDSAELQVMMETLQNNDHLFLVTDPTTGQVFQLGDANIPANIIKMSFTSGNTREGVKGLMIEVESVTRYLYTGDIVEATA